MEEEVRVCRTRELYPREAKRGRIVAQMKFRARDFHRDPFLHSRHYPRAPSLIPSSFFRYLLLFRSADRTRPQQRRAFPAGKARRADEYLSERKTNSRSAPTLSRLPPSFALSRPSLHGVRPPRREEACAGVEVRFVCGKKSLRRESRSCAHHIVCARASGMQGIEGGGPRYRGGSKKRRAHTRRSSANI